MSNLRNILEGVCGEKDIDHAQAEILRLIPDEKEIVDKVINRPNFDVMLGHNKEAMQELAQEFRLVILKNLTGDK